MYFDDIDDNKEGWQQDLKSWKNRRKSASSLKHRYDDDDDDDATVVTSSKLGESEVATKSKSLKNRKWNKFRSMDDDDDDYDVDEDDDQQLQQQQQQQQPQHKQQHKSIQSSSSSSSSSSSASPLASSTSSTWRPQEANQKTNHSRDAGAPNNAISMTTEARSARDNKQGVLQEKVIKINQRSNNPRGFGFELDGGREDQLPVTISRVTRGSSADICGLKAGDVVLRLNGVDVSRHYKDSMRTVVQEAVEKGVIELKIRRVKTSTEDALSDEEELEIGLNPRNARWSGSQSSYRSTPPLPPQPDYANDCFVESPSPLPSAPPVNWSTFPDPNTQIAASGDNTPTENGNSMAGGSNHFFDTTITESDVGMAFRANSSRRSSSPGYADSSSSQSSAKHPADQLKENLAMQKCRFLGMEPEQSEELKALKDKKRFHGRLYETSFPATSDSDEGYNSHKYVAEFSAAELDHESSSNRPKNISKDSNFVSGSELPLDRSTNEKVHSISRIGEKSFEGRDSDATTAGDKFESRRSRGGKQADDESKLKKSSEIDRESEIRTFKSNLETRSDSRSFNRFRGDPAKDENWRKDFKTKNESIVKVEVSRNAAAEWKKRDKELKEKEEKEKRDMKDRYDKFNKDSNLLIISSEKTQATQSKAAQPENASKGYSYSFFTGNKSSEVSPDNDRPSTFHGSAEAPSSSNNFKVSDQFGLKKSEYKPIKFQVNKFESTTSARTFKPSSLSNSFEMPQEGFIKDEKNKNIEKGEEINSLYRQSENIEPSKFTSSNTSEISKPQNSRETTWKDGLPKTVTTKEHDYHIAPTKSDDFPSFSTEKPRALENSKMSQSLKEEELEVQRLKEQQEIEMKRLERLREEKKVEELRLMRVKEEEEVMRMREQRLKEENEIKKLEKQRLRSEVEGENRRNQQKVDSIEPKSSNNHDAIKHSQNVTHPSQSESNHSIKKINEENVGNPYARLSRDILKDAGLSYDKTTVKTIHLNKPNFFGNSDKRGTSDETGHVVSPSPKYQSPNSYDSSSAFEQKTFNYNDYANPPAKPPAYFGPTFKRLNTNSQEGDGSVRHHHVRSHSGSETSFYRPEYESNINFLLYGENPPNDVQPGYRFQENTTKDTAFSGKGLNAKPSVSHLPNENHNVAKNVSKHWLVEEAERQRKAGAEGKLRRPSYYESRVAVGPHNSNDAGQASQSQEKSKLRTSKTELNNFNSNNRRLPTEPSYSGQERRMSSTSHLSDNSAPVTAFTYSSFAQPPHHTRSLSSDQQAKFSVSTKDSAADRLFPRKDSSSSSHRFVSSNNSSINNNNERVNDRNTSNNNNYTSSAVDSLFAYNNPQDYRGVNHQHQNRSTPKNSQLMNKKLSASTTNLSHGTWDEQNNPRGLAVHGSKSDQSNDDSYHRRPYTANNWPNHNRTASHFAMGQRNY